MSEVEEAEAEGIESESEVELIKVINSNDGLVNFYSMSTDTSAAVAPSISGAIGIKPNHADAAGSGANCEKVSDISKNDQNLEKMVLPGTDTSDLQKFWIKPNKATQSLRD